MFLAFGGSRYGKSHQQEQLRPDSGTAADDDAVAWTPGFGTT